ncbi:MAG: NCS2 family permease [Clostridia bacterium]|nr:NCS2 family permease [Clostridia bacterium]
MLEKLFKLKEHNTDVKTEVLAGITIFMTMAYILAVNPSILADAGMDRGAVFTATAIASFIGTLLMALFANYPFALAPGMGLNAYFAYTVVIGMGYSWEIALTAVFVEGIIFILLSLTNIRTAIFNAIPMTLKTAVSVGIGLYIAIIGLKNANIVTGSLSLFTIDGYIAAKGLEAGAVGMHDVGITVLLAIIGTIITAVLVARNVKGNILLGILITWILGIICQFAGLYVPNASAGFYSLLPDFSAGISIPSIAPVFCKLDFSNVLSVDFVVVVFAFLFVDLFDTIGTLIGVSSKAGLLDKDGKLPRIKGALLADAVATTAGAVLGTSTTTTYIESASGVTEGGRTGLTALVTAILFAVALLLSPIFLAIPSFATAPALIIVGFYMVTNIANIDFNNAFEAIPAYICMIAMPFFSSISEGISMGIISYTVLYIINPDKKSKLGILMYILSILFIIKYFVL